MHLPRLPDGSIFDSKQWMQIVIQRDPAKGKRYQGGWSIQIVFKNMEKDQVVTRHQIEIDGTIVHDHFRPGGLKTT